MDETKAIHKVHRNSVFIAGLIVAVSIVSFFSGLALYNSSFSAYEVDSRSVTGVIFGQYPYDSWIIDSYTLQLIPSKKTIELRLPLRYYDAGNYSAALTFPYRVQSIFDLGETTIEHNWTYRNAESGSVVMGTLVVDETPIDGLGFQVLSAELTLNDSITDRVFDFCRISLPFGGSFTLDVQEAWDSLKSITRISPTGQAPNCSLSVIISSTAIISDKSHSILRRDPAKDSQQILQFQITGDGPFSLQYSMPEERYRREQNLFISGILIGVLPAGLLSVLGIIEQRWVESEQDANDIEGKMKTEKLQTNSSLGPQDPWKEPSNQLAQVNERKLERLDAAFLFLLSFVGIVVSFLQAATINLGAFIEALPFLMLGIVLPFYVGYLRGAIEIDTAEERMRGWIFALIGTTYYLGSFVIAWLNFHYSNLPYVYGLSIMYSMVFGSLILTCRTLRWSSKMFQFRKTAAQYVFSITGLSAIAGGFLLSILIAFVRDSYSRDIVGMILAGSPEPIFWLSIILAAVCFISVAERGARAISAADVRMREFEGLASRLMNNSVLRGLILGSVLFEYSFDFNLKARLLWLQSFVLWVLGCFLWIASVSLLPQVFLTSSIGTLLIATVLFHKTGAMSFEGLEKRFSIKTDYMALVFVTIVAMLLFGVVLQGMILIVALTIFFLFVQT